jgi:hypothetical protein
MNGTPNDKTLHRFVCTECGGNVISHEPPHEMTVYKESLLTGTNCTTVHLLCIECVDYIAEVSWNDEAWGPYPSRLQHRREVGGA